MPTRRGATAAQPKVAEPATLPSVNPTIGAALIASSEQLPPQAARTSVPALPLPRPFRTIGTAASGRSGQRHTQAHAVTPRPPGVDLLAAGDIGDPMATAKKELPKPPGCVTTSWTSSGKSCTPARAACGRRSHGRTSPGWPGTTSAPDHLHTGMLQPDNQARIPSSHAAVTPCLQNRPKLSDTVAHLASGSNRNAAAAPTPAPACSLGTQPQTPLPTVTHMAVWGKGGGLRRTGLPRLNRRG